MIEQNNIDNVLESFDFTIEPKKLIPRKTEVINENFSKNTEQKINIIFENLGLKVNISTPLKTPLKSLIRKYLSLLGLNENVLKGQIIFIYNAMKLNVNDQRPISDVFGGQVTIIVIETQWAIGAKNF